MTSSLLRHELRSRRGAIAGWGLGLAIFGSFYVAIFPEVSAQMTALADLSIYRALAMDLTSFEGFIASSIVQFTPVLLGIYAIMTSTDAMAGEEDRGELEILLAMPVRRARLVSTKALAVAVALASILLVAGTATALALRSIEGKVEVGVTPVELFLAILSGLPVVLAFAMIGLFFGVYLPDRRAAASATTAVFVASYFGEIVARMADRLDGIGRLSPFSYFDSTATLFTEGVHAGDVAVLVGVAGLFFGLALASFERRNVTAGSWPWRRQGPP